MRKVIIMGAGGRDFHNFNVVFRARPRDARSSPSRRRRSRGSRTASIRPRSPGRSIPKGIPIRPEEELTELVRAHGVDEVILAYSDLKHETVMHKASLVLAAGADFRLLGPDATMLALVEARRRRLRRPHRLRQEPDQPQGRPDAARRRPAGRARPSPDAVRRPRGDARAAVRDARGHRRLASDGRGARGVRGAGAARHGHVRRRRLRGDPPPGRAGGRRDRLGRRQQRPPVLQAGPPDRRRRSAAAGPRARLPPGRDEPPHGRRRRDQQGRHGRRARRRSRRRERPGREPARAGRLRQVAAGPRRRPRPARQDACS